MPITIGIPIYNAEAYLADAIRSVFAQTYQEWELLLIDDGSTDRSLDLAHAVRDSRVRVISDGENKKLPYRLNQITREAKFDLIGRMDADDLISPSRFERQVNVLLENPSIDLVTTGLYSINNEGLPVGLRIADPDSAITGRGLLLGSAGIVHAAILGRKSWFVRNQYDPKVIFAEDYELWLRAFSKNDFRIQIIDEPMYYYREEGNVSEEKILTAYNNAPALYRKYGHLGFSPMQIAFLLMRVKCKSAVVRLLSRIGKLELLLRHRNRPLSSEIVSLATAELEVVLNTTVPGLD